MNRVCFEQVFEWNIALDRMISRELQDLGIDRADHL